MKGPAARTITAVVVDYYTRSATRRLVEDLRTQPGIAQIIVVDNSGDSDYAAEWPLDGGFELSVASTRQGYGAGANLGARVAEGELLLILNSDLRVVSGEFASMAESIDAADGVVGPLIVDPQGFPQRDAWGLLPAVVPAGAASEPRWITGACMMLERDVFLDVGGFDERFFMYWEDVDLCRQLWEHQLRVRVDARVTLSHVGGLSQSSALEKYRHAARSRDLYLAKWSAPRITRLRARARRVTRTAYPRGKGS